MPQSDPFDPSGPMGRTTRQWVLLGGLIALCSLIELALSASDWGLIQTPRFRQTAYEFGGFWPGLLSDWRPNYPLQPATMFFSYGFFHGGPGHLIVNMFTLFSLGSAVMDRAGGKGFALIYGASILGGAVAYAVLAQTPQPMVGASGALFGLAGALVGWNLIDSFDLKESLWPFARIAAFLVAINVVMWWALNGQLAWQTHLGGFVSGFLVALWYARR